MEFGIQGIKCDAEGCDYEERDIDWGNTAESILAKNDELLNAPCPKCGANLLTPEDHASVKMMVALAPEISELEEELKKILPEGHPDLERVRVDLSMDGSGAVGIGNIEKL